METLAAAETRWIELTLIDLSADARTHDPAAVEALAEDMKINGQLQEIVVSDSVIGGTPDSGSTTYHVPRYKVVAGVGRTLAARKLGWDKIRCLVRPGLSEFDRLHITFSENEEREDASPLYQAQLLKRMQDAGQFKTQDDLAEKIGKSRGSITQYMVISRLEPQVQESVNRLTNLGMAHILQICRLKTPEQQVQLAEQASKGEWSVKQLKGEVDKRLQGNKPEVDKKSSKDPYNVRGIQFKESGRQVLVSIPYDRTKDLEVFLEGFKEEMTLWCRQHPYTPTAEDVAAKAKEQEDYKAYVAKSDAYEKELAERQAYLSSHPKKG